VRWGADYIDHSQSVLLLERLLQEKNSRLEEERICRSAMLTLVLGCWDITLTSFQHLLYKVHLRFIFKKQRDKSKQIWQRFSSWQVSFLFMCCLGSRAIGKQQQQSWHYVDLLQYRARRVSGSHSKLIAELAADNKCNCAYENQSYGIVNMYLTSFQTSP